MTNIMLFNPDNRTFDASAIEQVFRSETGFRDVRLHAPGGAIVEADFVEPDDWSIVTLSESGKSISLSGVTDAALRAALVLQRSLRTPLRIIDSDYSFDLIFQDCENVEGLRAAIERAQAS